MILFLPIIYDKRDDIDYEIVNFPFLDDDAPRSTPYGVHNFQLVRLGRISSHVADFNTRNKVLTQKPFSKFHRRYYNWISKFQAGLKSLPRQGLLEPMF